MKRACANCETEKGVLDRADASKTHGFCLKHFVTILLQGGAAWKDIAEGIREVRAGDGFVGETSTKRNNEQ